MEGVVVRGSWTVAAGASACALVCATGSAAAAQPALNAKAAKQIAALQEIKRSLTPAERKLDSRLVVTLRRRADKAASAIAAAARDGRRRLLLGSHGGRRAGRRRYGRAARAPGARGRPGALGVEAGGVAACRDSDGCAQVRRALGRRARGRGRRRGDDASGGGSGRCARNPSRRRRGDSRRNSTTRSRPRPPRSRAKWCPRAKGPRHRHGARDDAVTGIGVKVCALSNGVDSLAASQAAGELPAGRRPARSRLATATRARRCSRSSTISRQGGAGLRHGIHQRGLLRRQHPRAALGSRDCDIIVDDVLYFNESPFQDGPIAQAVNAVTEDGALYFSSAGNEGNTIDGTSGNYEGDFVDSGQRVGKFVGAAHDFDPGRWRPDRTIPCRTRAAACR